MSTALTLSIVIPTYRREQVLLDTIDCLLPLMAEVGNCLELLIVDQTEQHEPGTACRLREWDHEKKIRWIVLDTPHITRSMNRGVQLAKGDIVLFLDDDIVPGSNLLREHLSAYTKQSGAWAVVGQVIQPEDVGKNTETLKRGKSENLKRAWNKISVFQHFSISAFQPSPLRRDLDFKFSGTEPAWIENAMGGNLSVRKNRFIQLGGFDENFTPPVASRFETEFAKRLIEGGGKIRFEPAASIRHLRAGQGGTRCRGSHLTSASPLHGVGDYYYAMRCGQGIDRAMYMIKRPFREVRTTFHLTHPWFIPAKLLGELRAICLAFKLVGSRRRDLVQADRNLYNSKKGDPLC